MKYYVEVRGRPWAKTQSMLPPPRDVYMRAIEDDDQSAHVPFLNHVDCPFATAQQIAAWAVALGYRVEYNPPACINHDWRPESPVEPPPPPPPMKPDSALVF